MAENPAAADVKTKCRWCGGVDPHPGEACSYVKAFNFDPDTGVVIRVEFVTAADFKQVESEPEQSDYRKKKAM